jgi:hypothetical protein
MKYLLAAAAGFIAGVAATIAVDQARSRASSRDGGDAAAQTGSTG